MSTLTNASYKHVFVTAFSEVGQDVIHVCLYSCMQKAASLTTLLLLVYFDPYSANGMCLLQLSLFSLKEEHLLIMKIEEHGSHSGFEAEGNDALAVQSLKLSSCVRVLTL